MKISKKLNIYLYNNAFEEIFMIGTLGRKNMEVCITMAKRRTREDVEC